MRSSSRGAERKRKRKRGDLKWRQGISIGQHRLTRPRLYSGGADWPVLPLPTRIHYTCFELDQLGHPARELRDLRAHARGAAA